MSKTKEYYAEQLAQADEELWDRLEEQWLMLQDPYAYEDSSNPNATAQPNNPNIVRHETKESE